MTDLTQPRERSMSEILRDANVPLPRPDSTTPIIEPAAMPPLGESAQLLLANANQNVDRILDYGIAKIEKIEEICKVAKQLLETKRNQVNSSMTEYVAALEAVHNTTETMDKSLSEVLVQIQNL